MSLSHICRLFGVSRQAYYQHFWQEQHNKIEQRLVIKQVLDLRDKHKAMGTRKLYMRIQPFLQEHQIKMGRDSLFNLLAANGLLVRKRKRRMSTTMSYHRFHKWPNLITNFTPERPNHLYVSDITYWKIGSGFVYISLVTDAYSHKIVGYHAGQTLAVNGTIQALMMALSGLERGPESHHQLIHHSDRGIQYCSDEYVKLLQDNNIKISMTENSDPRENAIAERVNGILKEEYFAYYQIDTLEEARKLLENTVKLYNQERPHMSNGYLTPNQIHYSMMKPLKMWKNYYPKKYPVNL